MVGQIRSSKAVRAGAGCWEPTLPRRRRLVPRSTTTGQSRSRRYERSVRIRSRRASPPGGSRLRVLPRHQHAVKVMRIGARWSSLTKRLT